METKSFCIRIGLRNAGTCREKLLQDWEPYHHLFLAIIFQTLVPKSYRTTILISFQEGVVYEVTEK